MKKYFIPLLFFLFCLEKTFPISVSFEDASKIGEKIWENECDGTLEGLTHWKKGENFASLGIGHFIWYPIGKREQFYETFPSLLQFCLKEKVTLLNWLKTSPGCPWDSRESFYEDIHSQKMENLREFLFETRSLQAIFIASRLENILPSMLENCCEMERNKIIYLFYNFAKNAEGLYVLIDYLTFKGSGTSPQESYNGQGWGLLQVLQRFPQYSEEPLVDFVNTAKEILSERVQNAPPERQEKQWLEGWFNRLDTYLGFQKKEKYFTSSLKDL